MNRAKSKNSLLRPTPYALRPLKRGQVGIETTVAMIAVFIFLLGATQVFLWTNRNIIERQREYQNSRTQLTEAGTTDFYHPQRLYVFPQERPDDTGGR